MNYAHVRTAKSLLIKCGFFKFFQPFSHVIKVLKLAKGNRPGPCIRAFTVDSRDSALYREISLNAPHRDRTSNDVRLKNNKKK